MSASYTVIDISKYNTASNYTTAASNIDGVIIRAGYRGYGASGTLVTDSLFETHYSGFKDLTKIGVYWFSQAITTTEAVNEANYLYNLIKDKEIDFPIYINSDYANSTQSGRADNLSKTERTTMLVALCDRLTQLGYSTGVYASESWFNTSLDLDTIQEKGYSLIVTKYSETQPSITDYDAWNYTASAMVNGINNVCNMSTFYKDVAGWVTVKPDIADYELVVEQTEFDYT
jgi:GH25 family lysozyme M1 (1,4-beta-N-acetylmuramidase)